MASLTDMLLDFLDNVAWKLSPHPKLPSGPIVCNVSDETDRWNRAALDYAWKPGNGIVPLPPARVISAEEVRVRQEQTYEDNRRALDYVQNRE